MQILAEEIICKNALFQESYMKIIHSADVHQPLTGSRKGRQQGEGTCKA